MLDFRYLMVFYPIFAISALQNRIIVVLLWSKKCIWRRFTKHIGIWSNTFNRR